MESGLDFNNPVGTGGMLDVCLCCSGVAGEWVGSLEQDLEGWCYVWVSPDSLCRWQVHVSVYCVWQISQIQTVCV